MQTFLEFVDKKQREAKRHLKIMQKLLESSGLRIKSYVDDDEEPYVYLHNPSKKVTFDGVRIYQIGDQLAYRVQKEEKTHPYGKAYQLDIENMFSDYIGDQIDEMEAGKLVIKSVIEELNKFFNRTSQAEVELAAGEFGSPDPLGSVIIRSTGSDWSTLVHSQST